MQLTSHQLRRYARHIILPEIGAAGQSRLLQSKVVVVGLGGLGSAIASYLAAAGIGRIGLVDDDKVELSNLQRQPIHHYDRIGQAKVTSAVHGLKLIDPNLSYQPIEQRLNTDNGEAIVKDYDIIVDGTDNISSRYWLNELGYRQKKPVIFGACARFEAQVIVSRSFDHSGCYRCLFPDIPESAQSCHQQGVLGAVAGVAGTLQATETVKMILGLTVGGYCILYDALSAHFSRIELSHQTDCLTCGDGAS